MHITIGDIAEEIKTVTPSTKCEEVYRMFNEIPSLEGIVVCSDEQPVGLVMKTHFYQKLSTKYGFDLFMKRTIDLVMDQELLTVDYSVPIAEVSALAMNRKQGNIYDCVIVTKKDRMYGIVSIRELLIKLSEVQIRIARYSNPLTGLPGNSVIEETLQEVLSYRSFSVLYIDIDSFKVFNDTYGFREGDELIRETANIVTETILTADNEPSFVGHIGGDDFIAVIPHFHHEGICNSIITRFDNSIHRFYSKEDLEKGYVQAISRQGILENVPLVSISIAVIQNTNNSLTTVEQLSKKAAKVKKRCKAVKKSVFLTLEDLDEEFIKLV
ncbi:GGDEF domain-containing protein [Bacillus sp. V33-4]|uniref:GGDEF domain-containing protein n=1 Tax=Bacillus sp. V33-4 TaxID=2054169 RepID=UPI000C765FCA|nr:GGDEF domain-containing protein [Bacillus sp. V33-4]PLR85145.1 GGDEF domain-containing protein [Bacillus sp. V33-4]